MAPSFRRLPGASSDTHSEVPSQLRVSSARKQTFTNKQRCRRNRWLDLHWANNAVGFKRMMDGQGPATKTAKVIGLVNPAAPLSVELQRRALADAGCEMAFEVTGGAGSDKRIGDLLQRMGAGSRLMLTGLAALNRSVAECLRLAASLLEAGVEICIVDPQGGQTLAPGFGAAQAMRIASSFAGQAKAQSTSTNGRPSTGEVLSPVQRRFARKLYQAGESVRTISQICRASPNAVIAVVDRER